MSVLIRRNAPDLEDRRKRPPTGQVAVTVDLLGAEFSKFLSSISEGTTPHPTTFYGETLQKRPLTFSGWEITGRAAANMRSHDEWSGAESCS